MHDLNAVKHQVLFKIHFVKNKNNAKMKNVHALNELCLKQGLEFLFSLIIIMLCCM